MKILSLFFFLYSSLALSHFANTKDSESSVYANIYADELISKFDKGLDLGRIDFEIYREILGARDYIEHRGQVLGIAERSLVNVKNTSLYLSVIEEIKKNASKIIIEDSRVKRRENFVIFPSTTSKGNLTGNTFPRGVWSLTFDDGPHPSRTNKVIDNLYKRGLSASFFVLSSLAKKFPQIIEKIVDSKLEIANHSFSHKNLNKLSDEKLVAEIDKAKETIEDVSKESVKLFRLPYGSGMRNKEVRQVIAKSKMVHVFWNVDTLDWKDKDPKSILKRVKKLMELTPNKSGIILFHDIHKQSVIASEMVMDYLQEEGKLICNVGEVVQFLNQKEQGCIR